MRLSKIRVLVADDHQQMREYVRDLLSAHSCEVVAAVGDGQAAVDAAIQFVPDVAILDISMPILNGIEVARRLQTVCPSVSIVFLTVDKDRDTCRTALETGAQGYVLKPRLGTDLLLAVQLAKEKRRFVSPECE